MLKRSRGQDLFSRQAALACSQAKSDARESFEKIANYAEAKCLEMAQLLIMKDEIREEAMLFILSSEVHTAVVI